MTALVAGDVGRRRRAMVLSPAVVGLDADVHDLDLDHCGGLRGDQGDAARDRRLMAGAALRERPRPHLA